MSLCKATELANQAGMNFHLILTGFGTEKDALEKYALLTNGRIEVNSPVPHDQVPSLLAKAHVGVLPFPDEEKYRVSSPIKLFEYMASGMTIMATRVVCHTDVIRDDSYTFWADDATVQGLFETLKLIWKSRTILESMGKKSALASQYWSWHESAKKLSQALLHGLMIRVQNHPKGLNEYGSVRRH